ncbi:unnamed protein product [Prorocentrum cordatum]|uniref:Uncharacterized protein n=1 Tax=Prorocentrum cordatum TaxID=2364126 RepID=A0ABN9RRS9_9DINO|nr:unnamed protein product [Polarella glacialis]
MSVEALLAELQGANGKSDGCAVSRRRRTRRLRSSRLQSPMGRQVEFSQNELNYSNYDDECRKMAQSFFYQLTMQKEGARSASNGKFAIKTGWMPDVVRASSATRRTWGAPSRGR